MASKYVPLKGGLDQATSPLEVSWGRMKDGLNFAESTEGGYESLAGLEVYDGQPSPSDNVYYFATFDSWDTKVTDIAAGDDITVGGMDMHVLATDTDTADTLIAVVCSVVGTIPVDLDTTPENWDGVSSLVAMSLSAAETEALHETYLEAAWTYSRALIAAVPGNDAYVKGVLQIDDTVVAFRNATGVPTIYYSSGTGWTAGRIGRVAEITATAADELVVGETFDSGKHVIMAICAWYNADGTPDVTKNWLVIAPTTAQDEPATGSHTGSIGANTFTIASVIQPIGTLGDYIEYENHNFLSHPEDEASWLCDGVNLPMCYSPTYKTLLPISYNFNQLSGQLATEIHVHGEKLHYSTGTGTFNISEPGNPQNYSGLYGAANIGVGDFVTAMESADSEHLIAFTKRAAKKLLGSDSSDWDFDIAAGNAGSEAHGAQKLDDLFTLSKRGIAALTRTNTQGGYAAGSISQDIQTLVKGLSAKLTCSTSLKDKEQVRWYMNDGTFLVMTRVVTPEGYYYSFGRGYYPDYVIRGVSTETWSDGVERTFAVAADGFVYQLDKGTNLNGEEIYSFIKLHSNHLGTPGNNKGFKRVFFESKSVQYALMSLSFDLNYGEKEFDAKDIEVTGGVDIYNEALYDVARYDTTDNQRSRSPLKGRGFTIGFTIDHTSKFAAPFRLTGYTVEYSLLGRAVK